MDERDIGRRGVRPGGLDETLRVVCERVDRVAPREIGMVCASFLVVCHEADDPVERIARGVIGRAAAWAGRAPSKDAVQRTAAELRAMRWLLALHRTIEPGDMTALAAG